MILSQHMQMSGHHVVHLKMTGRARASLGGGHARPALRSRRQEPTRGSRPLAAEPSTEAECLWVPSSQLAVDRPVCEELAACRKAARLLGQQRAGA